MDVSGKVVLVTGGGGGIGGGIAQAFVEKGALLYTIDPQPFQAKVAQAQAMLAQTRTALVKTRSDLARIRPLAAMNAVSKIDLDAAVANYEAAQNQEAAAKAQVQLAQLELGYTQIHAPEQGLIGLSQAEVGDYVSQSNNGGLLNVISRTDPNEQESVVLLPELDAIHV